MITHAERKARKKKAIEAIVFAYSAIDTLDNLLSFNKRLMGNASDIKFRHAILLERLESKR